MCNHNLNDTNNTLIKINIKKMVFPDTTYMCCKRCNEIFKFVKNENGIYELKN